MSKRHKHADLIHAWAEGAKIQVKTSLQDWQDARNPFWAAETNYRIKPKEPEWYENIPPQGVLCWVSDSQDKPDMENQVTRIMYKTRDYFVTSNKANWNYATPLTNDEIRQFFRVDQ